MSVARWEDLQIKDDFMFGIIMSDPEICRLTLERILGVSIDRVEYPEKQKYIAIVRGRHAIRLDVYVKDGKGTVYNIEMQVGNDENLALRSRYYQGMIDLNLISAGDGYSELKESFVIFICTFDPFGKGRHKYTFQSRCIEEPGLRLGDRATKIFLNARGTMDDVDGNVKRFLHFIDKASEPDPEDELLVRMHHELITVRLDKRWRQEYMKYELELEKQRNLGREEGREEGRKDGILSIASRMLDSGAFTEEMIILATGMTAEELKMLREVKMKND